MNKLFLFFFFIPGFLFSQKLPADYSVTSAGKFERHSPYKVSSVNGLYTCNYEIESAGDEVRKLTGFRFYINGNVKYTLNDVPGSDLYISNSGIAAFMDHSLHFRNILKVNFYSPEGIKIFSETFTGAFVFGFSPDGNYMGIGTPDNFNLISPLKQQVIKYPECLDFDISNNAERLVLAAENSISLYEGKKLVSSTGIPGLVRKIKFTGNSSYCYITKNYFIKREWGSNNLIFSNEIQDKSYNDLLVLGKKVFLGIIEKENNLITGYFSEFSENNISMPVKISEKNYYHAPEALKQISDSIYDPIPWPFFPFDSTRTVWNHYEQNMGYGDNSFSYLHQGLDLIVPVAEPAYAVQRGVVKCVLTIGGESYWRLAVSPEQNPGRTDGWLYAHLISSSIAVNVGDTVELHDFLGEMIYWAEDWAHIHFVQISDSGTVWLYNDNEWGINFNPLLALENVDDTIPPVIEQSTPTSKFEFCTNETSVYLSPDSLHGQVDIIIKAADYIGKSRWQQPAYKSYYYLKRISDDSVMVPRTMGHILNHKYPFYASDHYEDYAKVLYKLDYLHPASSWMDTLRNYYHIITNNNGDELLDLNEKNLALNTSLYYDDTYRIYVEVFDPSGNSDTDSMDVKFRNGFVSVNDPAVISDYALFQNFPNPFNPSTKIKFVIPSAQKISLSVYDILGNKIADLINEERSAGEHETEFDAGVSGLASGIYFYKLQAGNFSSVKKLIYLK